MEEDCAEVFIAGPLYDKVAARAALLGIEVWDYIEQALEYAMANEEEADDKTEMAGRAN